MKKLLPLSLIIFVALFFRLYRLTDRYYFEWDQADDAKKSMEIVRGKFRLIGPKVANEDTFFVGPQHYYFLAPFYLIGHGNPYSGAAPMVIVGLISSLIPYLFFSSLLSSRAAFIASLLIALNPDLHSWNAMYATPYSLLVLFLSLLILNRTIDSRLPYLLFFVLGFATTTHLANAILIIPVSVLLLVKRIKLNYLLALLFFLAPFLPLLIFDLRHQFLNLHKLLTFSRQTPPTYHLSSLVIFWKSLAVFPLPIPAIWQKILLLMALIFSLTFTNNRIGGWFPILWFISPAVFLYFYQHQVPEYYFVSALILLPITLAICLKKILYPYLAIFILLFLTITQLFKVNQAPDGKTLQNKLQLVDCLARHINYNQFYLSYDLPQGWHNGYDYLLNYRRLTSQINPQSQLYTITTDPIDKDDKVICRSGILYLIKK